MVSKSVKAMPEPAPGGQSLKLSMLLQMEQRARTSTPKELEFLMLNETTVLVPYQQAALWQGDAEDGRLTGVSGAAQLETGAPYLLWLKQILPVFAKKKGLVPVPVSRADLPATAAKDWAEWFPPYALWCPLPYPGGKPGGGLLLGRPEPWQEPEIQLLALLASGYGQCLAVAELQKSAKPLHSYWIPRRKTLAVVTVAIIAAIACLPVRVSVLAPAEIVPLNPAPIRAPFDGVIASVDVTPNANVHAGQKLLTFDTSELKAKSDMAAKALEMAQAEYTATAQEALNDAQAKAKVSMLESKIEQQQAELNYNKNLLSRADVTAPIDGVAVFDDPVNWIGKPVTIGERVMLVAPPQDAALEIQVPVADVVTFKPGAEVLFFSNISPADPSAGTLTFASYGSNMTAEGVLAYTFRATLDKKGGDLRLGLKGTAKIYGDRRPLALWLLRRPLALLRQWLVL